MLVSDSSPPSFICLENSCISVGSMRPILDTNPDIWQSVQPVFTCVTKAHAGLTGAAYNSQS
jgi:hypothetical protein